MNTVHGENAMLIWREDDMIKDQWLLNDPGTGLVLGRSTDCEITVPVRWVSRQHARLRAKGGQFFVEDVGSKNGVFVNGQRIVKPRTLQDGDIIQLAPGLELIYVDNDATAPLPNQKGMGLFIDQDERQIYIHSQLVKPPLSNQQFMFLSLLSQNPGKVYSREEVVEAVWPGEWADGVTDDAIDALVRRLRQRLNEIDPGQNFVVTVRGYGFKLDDGQ